MSDKPQYGWPLAPPKDPAHIPAETQPLSAASVEQLDAAALRGEATTFHGDAAQFWVFDLKGGGRVSIPPDQVRRMWNAEQRGELLHPRLAAVSPGGLLQSDAGRSIPRRSVPDSARGPRVIPAEKPWTCTACGDKYETRAAVERHLSGSKGDLETPGLCWVCARLRHSALAEVRLDMTEAVSLG